MKCLRAAREDELRSVEGNRGVETSAQTSGGLTTVRFMPLTDLRAEAEAKLDLRIPQSALQSFS
jgi:hypothetical protein